MPLLKALPGRTRRLHARLKVETAHRTRRSAVVFAPHQDDETLGCGGTIALKCNAGTPVSCVFMTDGVTSHQHLIEENELRRLRRREALEATAVLGMSAACVRFLDFPDGRLSSSHSAALEAVIDHLARQKPEEVYVPYRRDGTPDHEATFRIVATAVRELGDPLEVLEYPIWLWNQWPWVSLQLAPSRITLRAFRRAIGSRFGQALLREFRTGVFVRDVNEIKRAALSKHRSQMTVLEAGRPWPTLADVSGGEFLNCFFHDFEVFRSSRSLPFYRL